MALAQIPGRSICERGRFAAGRFRADESTRSRHAPAVVRSGTGPPRRRAGSARRCDVRRMGRAQRRELARVTRVERACRECRDRARRGIDDCTCASCDRQAIRRFASFASHACPRRCAASSRSRRARAPHVACGRREKRLVCRRPLDARSRTRRCDHDCRARHASQGGRRARAVRGLRGRRACPAWRVVMATPLPALHAPAPLARWWSTKSFVERRIVAAVALLALAAFAWGAVWPPIFRAIPLTPAANARAGAALAEARRMTEEMAGLARAAPPAAVADPRPDLERVLVEQNLRAPLTQQDWKDGRAR